MSVVAATVLFAVLLLLAALGLVYWLKVRGASQPQVPPQGKPVDFVTPWRAVRGDLGPKLRAGPVVIAVGDSGWKSSRVLEHLSGGCPATPSGLDEQLRTYRSQSAVVLEFSDDIMKNESIAVDQAWARLCGELPVGVVLVVLAIDFRALGEDAEAHLQKWSQILQKKVPFLRRGGRDVGLRVCVTGLECEVGYSRARDLLRADRSHPFSFDELADLKRMQAALAPIDEKLGAVLCHEPHALESTVRIAQILPRKLHSLRHLLEPLLELRRRYTKESLGGAFVCDKEGAALPSSPFLVANSELTALVAREERSLWWRSLAWATGVCVLTLLAFVFHAGRLSDAEEKVRAYNQAALAAASLVAKGSTNPDVDTDATVQLSLSAGAAVRSMERYWFLPFAFEPRRDAVQASLVEATRARFVEPALRPQESLSSRVLAAALDRAHDGNDFERVVEQNLRLWSQKLGIPQETTTDLIEYRRRRTNKGFVPTGAKKEWEDLIELIAAAVKEKFFERDELENAKKGVSLENLPSDPEELKLLERVVGLLVVEEQREAPNGASKLRELQQELQFVRANYVALRQLSLWLTASPDLEEAKAPASLLELVSTVQEAAPAPTAQETEATIQFSLKSEVSISRQAFWHAVRRTRSHFALQEFETSRVGLPQSLPSSSACPSSSIADRGGSGFFPWAARSGRGVRTWDWLTSYKGPSRAGYGPTRSLPGWFTREAFEKYVSPVLMQIPNVEAESALLAGDVDDLTQLIREQAKEYGERYGRELTCYYQSFQFNPTTLKQAERAIEDLAAEGSWFERFLKEFVHHADLPVANIPAGEFSLELPGFSGLSEAVGGSAIADYAELLTTSVPALGQTTRPEEDDSAEHVNPHFLAALDVIKATQKTASAEVLDSWFSSQNIERPARRPFELPWNSLRYAALREVRDHWRDVLVEPVVPLLRRYPFRIQEQAIGEAVSVEEIEEEFGPDGRLWTRVDQLFDVIVASRDGDSDDARRDWQMRRGIPEISSLLDYLQAAERLSTALWSSDGKLRRLIVTLTPSDLPFDEKGGGEIIGLAHLSFPGAGIESFNQALEKRRLRMKWWTKDASRLTIEVLDEFASEVVSSRTLASAEGEWSFLRILDTGGREHGKLSFPVPQEFGKSSSIEFEMEGDIRQIFLNVTGSQERNKSGS